MPVTQDDEVSSRTLQQSSSSGKKHLIKNGTFCTIHLKLRQHNI